MYENMYLKSTQTKKGSKMKKQNTENKKMSHKEVAEKYCSKCIYSENCEINGNWKCCPHAKMAK